MTIKAIAEAIATHDGRFYHTRPEHLDILAYLLDDDDRTALLFELDGCDADPSRKRELSSVIADNTAVHGTGTVWMYSAEKFDLIMDLVGLYIDGIGHVNKMLDMEYINFGLARKFPDGTNRQPLWPEISLFSILPTMGDACSIRYRSGYGSSGDYIPAMLSADNPERLKFVQRMRHNFIRDCGGILRAEDLRARSNLSGNKYVYKCGYEWCIDGCITETGHERYEAQSRDEIEKKVHQWREDNSVAL